MGNLTVCTLALANNFNGTTKSPFDPFEFNFLSNKIVSESSKKTNKIVYFYRITIDIIECVYKLLQYQYQTSKSQSLNLPSHILDKT